MPRKTSLTKEEVEATGTLFAEEFLYSTKKHLFICKYCGSEFLTTAEKVVTGHTKSCGCVSIGSRKGSKYFSGNFLDRCKRGAKMRSIDWRVKKSELDSIIKRQSFQCALTGRDLIYGYESLPNYTASLDRVDSKGCYTASNIQILHKDVNMAKQSLAQEEFINLCIEVSLHNECKLHRPH